MEKFLCPECGVEITDTRKDCPSCGFPADKLQKAKEEALLQEEEDKKKTEEKQEEKESKKVVEKAPFKVNPGAEIVLDTVASVVLFIGWFIVVFLFVAGFWMVSESADSAVFLVILGAIALVLSFTYIAWASLKVLVNISNNLYNIYSKLNDSDLPR